MSSTLFGRGTHTQSGVAARYERLEREIAELRKTAGGAGIQDALKVLREQVEAELKATRGQLETLNRKLDFQLTQQQQQIRQLKEALDKQTAEIAQIRTIVMPPAST